MKRHVLYYSLILVLCVGLSGVLSSVEKKAPAYDPGHKFSVKELKADFAILRTALEKGHGGMYRYTPKKEMDRQFDAIAAKLTVPMTERDFYRLLLWVVADVNDGHTSLKPSVASTGLYGEKPVFFPFKFRFLKKKAYLHRNYSNNPKIAMGGEVLSINGKPMQKILDVMLPQVCSDGRIETLKYRRMEFTSYFGARYNALFGSTTEYTFRYREPGTNLEKEYKVPGIAPARLKAVFKERYPEAAAKKKPIKLEYRGDVAILTVRTFAGFPYKAANMSYPDFLKKAFIEFREKKISRLIIDLRNNSGGRDDFGKFLFAYLYDKPYMYYESLTLRNIDLPFWKYTGDRNTEKLLKESTKKNAKGTYDALGHPNTGMQKPLKPTFKGKVFVLINGGSFSATGETTSLMHYYKLAKFVGEECGAGYYGNTSGIMPLVTLPNTELRLRLPMVKYAMAVKDYPPDRGIIPDFPIEPTMADVLEGKDPVLDLAVKEIKK